MLRLSAALLMVLLAGCSLTRSGEDPVQVRLNDLDARLTKLERIMANQSLLEMAQNQDALQAEVRGSLRRGRRSLAARTRGAGRRRRRRTIYVVPFGAAAHGWSRNARRRRWRDAGRRWR